MLRDIRQKPVRRVVGMMSGTSVDGIDAALVEISGTDTEPRVELKAFDNSPFPPRVREKIFELFDAQKATVDRLGYMNFLLGELYAQAALKVIAQAGLQPEDIDVIGSHGQTIWHAPQVCDNDGFPVAYTVQIGEGAVIADRTGILTVTDFRVGDVAAGGQGAPLVPFPEYLMYRREKESILLQNIGGIGNMTVLPAGALPEDVYAFDTGPGNMIIDAVVTALTRGKMTYDRNGEIAAKGKYRPELMERLTKDPYYAQPLPKSTGRELFGTQYTEKILQWQKERQVPDEDVVATVTELTAWSVSDAYERYVLPRHRADVLIVGGGGSYNPTLMGSIARRFTRYGIPVKTQEELGFSSDAKEAVAFAVLADRCVRESVNTIPRVTGARHAAVMGKLSFPPPKQ